MSNGIIPHTPEEKGRLITASAYVLANPGDAETIVASYGTDPDSMRALLSTEEGMQAALVRAEELRQGGALLKRESIGVLEMMVAQAKDMAEAGQITPGMLPKLMDTMFKLSGLAEERAARLRTQIEDDKPKATVFVLHGDDPEPPPAKPNEHRLIIRLPSAKKQPDIIDVTPTKGEGGGDGA